VWENNTVCVIHSWLNGIAMEKSPGCCQYVNGSNVALYVHLYFVIYLICLKGVLNYRPLTVTDHL